MKTQILKYWFLGLITLILLSCKKEPGRNLTGWSTIYQVTKNYHDPEVRAIAEDKNGSIWVSSGGIVINYNGSVCVTDTLTNNWLAYVTSIAVDAHNNKWFGINQDPAYNNYQQSNIALVKYDGINWITFNKTNSGLKSNFILSLAVDSLNDIWIGTQDAGVSTFDGTNWINYNKGNGLSNNWVTCIYIDKQGNKWFGTDGGGVCEFNDTKWTYFTMNDGLADNFIYSINFDQQGNKWFVTDIGLTKYDGTKLITYNNSNSGIFPYSSINLIDFDSSQNIWIAFYGGVAKFNGSNWATYNQSNSGLSGKNVYCILIDAQGNKWFGTDNGLNEFKD